MTIFEIYNIALITATALQGTILPVKYDVQDMALNITAVCCAERGVTDNLLKVKFHTDRVSNAGAVGVMQIKPKTAEWIMKKYSNKGIKSWQGDSALYNAEYNIYVGAVYLLYQYQRYQYDINKAFHAYMQGSYQGNNPEAGVKYTRWANEAKNYLLNTVNIQKEITSNNAEVLFKATGIMITTMGIINFFNKNVGVK